MNQLTCPTCSAVITSSDVNVQLVIATCSACDTIFSFAEQVGQPQDRSVERAVGDSDRPVPPVEHGGSETDTGDLRTLRNSHASGGCVTFRLLDEEWALLTSLPVDDLVALAADLDVLIPHDVDRRELLERCIPLLVQLAENEGLPFSKYDGPDLDELPTAHRIAIGRLLGIRGKVTVRAIVRTGQRKWRRNKARTSEAIPMVLPVLLGPVARHASERNSS